MKTSFALYTDECFADPEAAKTAHGILRFCADRVVAIVDRKASGQNAHALFPEFAPVPIVPSVADIPAAGTDRPDLVVGFAPVGGQLSGPQLDDIRSAALAGFRVVNGLHDLLDFPNVVNLREFNPREKWVAAGTPPPGFRVLTVGTSHSIGKMTATILLHRGLKAAGVDCDWIATGQTGMVIRGSGKVLDSIPIDFVPGHLERLLQESASIAPVSIIEGQGSIFHPSYAPTSFALFHTALPDVLVMCHRLGQHRFWGFDQSLPTVEAAVSTYRDLGAAFGCPSTLAAVSLDSSRVAPAEYEAERERLQDVLGVVVSDPVRDTFEPLASAVRRTLPPSVGGI